MKNDNLVIERQGVLFDYPELRCYDEDFLSLSPGRQREIEMATFEAEKWSPDGAVELYEYPEFFWWREDHGIEQEPELTSTDYWCPRCHSGRVIIGYPYIWCEHCGYNEPLIDFPSSRGDNVEVKEGGISLQGVGR